MFGLRGSARADRNDAEGRRAFKEGTQRKLKEHANKLKQQVNRINQEIKSRLDRIDATKLHVLLRKCLLEHLMQVVQQIRNDLLEAKQEWWANILVCQLFEQVDHFDVPCPVSPSLYNEAPPFVHAKKPRIGAAEAVPIEHGTSEFHGALITSLL